MIFFLEKVVAKHHGSTIHDDLTRADLAARRRFHSGQSTGCTAFSFDIPALKS
jgi:hypothetical protein